MGATTSAQLDAVFFALADPTRRAIVRQLAKGEATVGQLSLPQPLSPGTVSKHLHVLERAGLVARERDGRFLRTRLRPGPLWHGISWMEDVRMLWEQQLDALERYLEAQRGRRP